MPEAPQLDVSTVRQEIGQRTTNAQLDHYNI
jgi:hypothetical protein